ncbi:hypothetical protein SDC9_48732 [bioreactor metagenome]|uniref:Uncharacterized protein n=1 Tax=bioreactor metagenome TaxID=1076179 RepID=A0A644WIY5_9ZZZZ
MAQLQNQIHMYSIDTSFFYTTKETELLEKIKNLQTISNKELKEPYENKRKEIKKINDKLKENELYVEYKNILNQLKQLYKLRKSSIEKGINKKSHELHNQFAENETTIKNLYDYKQTLKIEVDKIEFLNIKDTEEYKKYETNKNEIEKLEIKLEKEFNKNIIRNITKEFTPADIISNFESSLTRTLNIETNDTTDKLIVIRVYHYNLFKNLIKNGFNYNKKHYIFFTSSSGQLKEKKAMFMEENAFNEHKNTIYCGLTKDKISEKKVIVNKYLSYLALTATASEKWENFNIDEVLIVDDMESILPNTEVKFIDYDNYDENGLWKITTEKKDIKIPVMDGAGICLDYTGIIRLPFLKGLVVQFSFKDFIKQKRMEEKRDARKKGIKLTETNIGKVKDIWNKEYDIIQDNIRYIFTKSQFKMWKYYDSWEEYKTAFKEYNCEASKCIEESKQFKKAKFSYQAWQSLYDLSDIELKEILKDTNETIENIGKDRQTILKTLGATEYNEKKNNWQEALMLYPEMLNDLYSKRILNETKASIINNSRYGKFKVDGTYTFILPDVYAFAEWLFCHNGNPKGLLKDGEVSCNHFADNQEVSLTRSPHLNFSHCVNKNVINDDTKKWYKASGVYTSIFSTNSLVMAYDVDGDETLIISEPTIVKSAKRIKEKHNFIPLYYEMKKGKPTKITNKSLYNSMTSAFGKSVGDTSNNITKIWNKGNIDEDEIKAMDYLTMWANFIIDFTKSQFLPTKSDEMSKFLSQYTNNKLPHFIRYIKDKNKNIYKMKTSDRESALDEKYAITNSSVVNRLEELVSNPPKTFKAKNCGKFDYKMLLHNKNIDTSTKQAKAIISKFKYLTGNKKFYSKEDVEEKHKYAKTFIKDETLKINNNEIYVVDVLVKYYYHDIKSDNKRSLWDSFGDIILENIKENIPANTILCEKCGERITKTNNRIKYCPECAKEINAEKTKNNKYKIAV